MGNDTKTIEEQLNKDFSSLYEWFIDNRISTKPYTLEKTKQNLLFFVLTATSNTEVNLVSDLEIKSNSTAWELNQGIYLMFLQKNPRLEKYSLSPMED